MAASFHPRFDKLIKNSLGMLVHIHPLMLKRSTLYLTFIKLLIALVKTPITRL